MPSLADIPPDLVDPDRYAHFSLWLIRLEIEAYIKKELLTLWAKATRTKLTREMVVECCGPDI